MKPNFQILPLVFVSTATLPLLSAVADVTGSSLYPHSLVSSLSTGISSRWTLISSSSRSMERVPSSQPGDSAIALRVDPQEGVRSHQLDKLSSGISEQGTMTKSDPLDSISTQLSPPPPLAGENPSGSVVVSAGDTLANIAQRYSISLADLLRLNPALHSTKLIVGSQIRLAQATPMPRPLLGVNPVGSGGLSWPDQPDFLDPNGTVPESGKTGFIWPTEGMFTSGYGWRWGRMHKGIDIANNVGTPIRAVQDGVVSFSGWDDGGYGYLIKVAHADGSTTVYAHNSSLLVRQGQEVKQGQTISLMGSTGRSTGPHLHFEVRPAGQSAVNPLGFLPPRV